jgi:hypothetical protein
MTFTGNKIVRGVIDCRQPRSLSRHAFPPPAPVETTSGTTPMMKAKEVIRIGRSRSRASYRSPALGSGLARRRRSQDVGAASSSERRRRWPTVSGKNGKNGQCCVAVDNAISIMRYRSRSRGRRWPAGTSARIPVQTSR